MAYICCGTAIRGLAILALILSIQCQAQRRHAGQRIARCGSSVANMEARGPCDSCRLHCVRLHGRAIFAVAILLPRHGKLLAMDMLCFFGLWVYGFSFRSPTGWQRAGDELKCKSRTSLHVFRPWHAEMAIFMLGS
jgi:hypothetical protein